MSKIFICYSNEDFNEVEKIVPDLKEKYHEPFMAPLNMKIGDWDKQINKEIDESDLFVVFLIESALKSKHVFREVQRMLCFPDSQKRIGIFSLHTRRELESMASSSGLPWNQTTKEFPQGVLDKLFMSHCYTESTWDQLRTLIKTKQISEDEPDIKPISYGKVRFPLFLITGGDGKLEIKNAFLPESVGEFLFGKFSKCVI